MTKALCFFAAAQVAIGLLATCTGLFRAVRVGVRLFCYSPDHWRGKPRETLAHVILPALYGSMSVTYLTV